MRVESEDFLHYLSTLKNLLYQEPDFIDRVCLDCWRFLAEKETCDEDHKILDCHKIAKKDVFIKVAQRYGKILATNDYVMPFTHRKWSTNSLDIKRGRAVRELKEITN